MTEDYPPYTSTPIATAGNSMTDQVPPTTEYSLPTEYSGAHDASDADAGTDDSDDTKTVAKDQAAQVGQGAVEAGQHVGAVAKDQASNVAGEAGRQAKDLIGQAHSELSQQAAQQQQRVSEGLRSLGSQLHAMADNSDQPGTATDLARQAGSKSHEIAGWLDDREPGQLLDEVKSFARQSPGTFLLIAAGAGLLGGRLTRGLKAANQDDSA